MKNFVIVIILVYCQLLLILPSYAGEPEPLTCYRCLHTTYEGGRKNPLCKQDPADVKLHKTENTCKKGKMEGYHSLALAQVQKSTDFQMIGKGDIPACIFLNVTFDNHEVVFRECSQVKKEDLNKCIVSPITIPPKDGEKDGFVCSCNKIGCNGIKNTADQGDRDRAIVADPKDDDDPDLVPDKKTSATTFKPTFDFFVLCSLYFLYSLTRFLNQNLV